MSLLKQIDPATNQIVDASPSDPKAAFVESLHRVEDAFTVAVDQHQKRADFAEAALKDLQVKHDEVLALLKDLRARLSGF